MNTTTTDARHKVSVIIPTYNVGRYLDQCLTSVESQPFRDIEIVCVNDGSTDDSLAIMQAHAARDPRYVIVDKANEGYGASCNRGIAASTGDYVAIVEPDDWVEGDMYGDLLRFADSLGAGTIDVIESGYWRILSPDTPEERRVNCGYNHRIHVKSQPFRIGEDAELLGHHPSIWTALYSRAFLDEFGIRMREYPGAGWADNPWLVETLCQARTIAYVDRQYYCYREDTPEKALAFASRSVFLPLERWNDMMDIVERLGVTDERVLQMMDKRASIYTGSAIEANGLDYPGLRDAIAHIYSRCDADRYLANPIITPGNKRLFCELTGRPDPKIPDISYLPELVRQGVYSIKNTGLRHTFGTVFDFTSRVKDRDAKR